MSTFAINPIESIHTTPPAPRAALDVYYTICPVFSASHIAVEFGWLAEEFKAAGANLKYLRALPEGRGWLPHFSHQLEGHLFRDGGNIPSIWAHADNRPTRLLGLTWSPYAGRVLVRADSDIFRVADLRGRKIGLNKSQNTAKVDFARGTAERGIESALALHGLRRTDVEIVDILSTDAPVTAAGTKPSDLWARNHRQNPSPYGEDALALRDGRIDAIYTHAPRHAFLEQTGEFKVIEDLAQQPDWTLKLANSPWAITVDNDLAEKAPEVPVAYLRSVIRAGRWINTHREAAATILQRISPQLSLEEVTVALRKIPDFEPNLSAQNLAGIQLQKKFLLSHGYVKRDFNVQDWAAPDLLAEAHRTL